jgi:hypothetical protein
MLRLYLTLRNPPASALQTSMPMAAVCWRWLKGRDFQRLGEVDGVYLLVGMVLLVSFGMLAASHAVAGLRYPAAEPRSTWPLSLRSNGFADRNGPVSPGSLCNSQARTAHDLPGPGLLASAGRSRHIPVLASNGSFCVAPISP